MKLRYGSVVSALASLRGGPVGLRPTHPGEVYRGRLRADLYVPPEATGASVVLVHGGGFVIGSRRMKPMRVLAERLVAAGLAVCAIDYRLIFRGGRLAEATDDVRAALAWWANRATALGLDPRAVTVVGLSAGGALALLAAAGGDVAGVVACFGLYEIDHLRGPAALLPRLLFETRDRAAWRARSPRFAPQPAAPTLLLHGDDDGLVPVDQARRLAAHREALGLPTRLVIYPETPHGFFNLPGPARDAGVAEIIAHATATRALR
jgi:acetyl esterase/lipase